MKRQLLVLLALASACGSGTAPPAGKPALAIDLFKAAPATIVLGESSQLVFAATAATKLTIDPGGIDVTGKSSLTVTPTADTTYTLTATDGAATASQTASVTVTQARPAAFRVTASGAAVAGSETTFSVAALGASGAVDANYHGTVRFSTDDPQGAVPGQIVFQAADDHLEDAREIKAITDAAGDLVEQIEPGQLCLEPGFRLLAFGDVQMHDDGAACPAVGHRCDGQQEPAFLRWRMTGIFNREAPGFICQHRPNAPSDLMRLG